VYFTAVTSGTGTITNKTYLAGTAPANKVLTGFESSANDVTVTLEIHSHGDPWQPESVRISGGGATTVTVTKDAWTQIASTRIWTASVALTDADTSGTLTAILSDGDTATCAYTRGLSDPLILTAAWDGTYPALQTQVKAGDTVTVTGTIETHATTIRVLASGATSSQQDFAGDYSSGTFSLSVVIGSGSGSMQFSLAASAGGTYGATLVTTDSPAIVLDQTLPVFNAPFIVYPAGQEALKDSEVCSVQIQHTNPDAGDTYLYESVDIFGTPVNELSIPSPTVYALTKTDVMRIGGDYVEAITDYNYRVTATRVTRNGASQSRSATVRIANIAPTVTIAGATTRLGTDDGSLNYLDHTITIQSSYANLSTYTPTLTAPRGAWQGAWSAFGLFNYTRSLRIADADILTGGQAANNYTWGACSVKNRAGLETIIVGVNTTYQLGGFATRTVTMGPIGGGDPPYTHTADIGVPVVDTAKTTVVNTSKGGTPTQVYEGVVTEHNNGDPSLNNFWTTVFALASDFFDDYTQYFHCSDRLFYESVVAGTYSCTIAESA